MSINTVFNIPCKIVALSLVLFMNPVGCRTPGTPMDNEDELPTDIDPYDASIIDDGGQPGAKCTEGTYVFNNDKSPYLGGEESVDVDVVYFSSFDCSHCVEFAHVIPEIWEKQPDFQNRVRIYFHHASKSFNHRATVAAYNQDQDNKGMENFWVLHDHIFDIKLEHPNTIKPTRDEIIAFVRDDLGLDMDRFMADVEDEKTLPFLAWDYEQADKAREDAEDEGIRTGTPLVFVCGQRLSSWTDLETDVNKYL